ncbi:MAG: hypothetical protein K2Z25_24705 [Beijerinckiaceae bacterium]|jgi:hypothetical protein|nr:hypothetical protein [Beijerinckiaceae bacterium]
MATTPKSAGQPEALATFAATARNAGHKPQNIGLEATAATKPLATSPAAKHDAATRVLQEGVTGKDHGADEAVDTLPDRAAGKPTGKA